MITDLRNPYPECHEKDLETIAYFMGKRIVKDGVNRLYYEYIPKSSITLGDMLNRKRLKPVTELPEEEQMQIKEFCIEEKVL